jgi:PAS domain S-box-containing protein
MAQLQKHLERENRYYRQLFESAPDGYLISDRHGIIRQINRIALALLGLDERFVCGKPLPLFVAEDERSLLRRRLLELRTAKSVQKWTIRVQAYRGRSFDAEVRATPIRNADGTLRAIGWIVRDLSDFVQAEQQRRAVELENLRLQQTIDQRFQALANFSHELRTPLNSIMGFSQMLVRNCGQLSDFQKADMAERIHRNGAHLLALIGDVLDFAKLTNQRMPLKPQVLDLRALVAQSLDEVRPLAERKFLTLDFDDRLGDPRAHHDWVRLRQVLFNLLSNAIKFTRVGGVRVALEECGAQRVSLTVYDTGVGIAETELEMIFEAFRQVGASEADPRGGTGLGLSITRALVEAMGGSIFVQSVLGEGSSFRIELPRAATGD